MATRWTSRINPLSWLTRRRPREAPVAPGGRAEYATPAAYTVTTQDDYSAADKPTNDSDLAWFAEEADEQEFSATHTQPRPRSTGIVKYGHARTRYLEYDSDSAKLRVEFVSGGTYEYDDVSMNMWQGISSAQSTGMWIDANLKPIREGVKVG